MRCRQQQPLPSPLGEGGPAGPDEGQAPAAALPRANRRGRRPRRPAKPCANTHPPGNHPRRGQDPSLRTEPLTGAHANPRARHARPLPCGGPGTGVRVNPAGVSISPYVGRGAPTPPRPPAAARPRTNRRGRRPRRPAEACADALPRVTTRGDSRCRQHPRRGQDPSLRTEPLTGAHANPRARHARPLPCGGPGTGVRVNPAGVSISPSVGRGAPTPPRPPAAAHSRANRRGRRPRRPAKPPANTHPPGNHPQTSAHANLRAGHARPLPRNNPTHLYTT